MRQSLIARYITLNLRYSFSISVRGRSSSSFDMCAAPLASPYIWSYLPGFTALGLAINKGDHAIVVLLLKCHASLSDIVAERDTDTPLEYALNRTGAGDRRGAVKVAIQLIQAGEWGPKGRARCSGVLLWWCSFCSLVQRFCLYQRQVHHGRQVIAMKEKPRT